MVDIALEIEIEGKGWLSAAIASPSLSLEVTGVIMNEDKGGVYSYPFTLDVDENMHIFGTSGELRGGKVYDIIRDARCKLIVGGTPLVQGKVSLDDSISVNVDSNTGHRTIEVKVVNRNKSYEDRIKSVKIRDLDLLKHKIQIGYTLPKEMYFSARYQRRIFNLMPYNEEMEEDDYFGKYTIDGQNYVVNGTAISTEMITKTRYVSLPHFLIPKYLDVLHNGRYSGNFVNVSEPYNPGSPLLHPYCNTRICYQKYEAEEDNGNTTWSTVRGYSIGEPDRINSAPCFYLGFVFDMTMAQMKIPVVKNALNDIMDYRRMAFWHADPQYETEAADDTNPTFSYTGGNNFKLEADYCGGRQYGDNKNYSVKVDGENYLYQYNFKGTPEGDLRKITPQYALHRAYATADNLPDMEVDELIRNMTSAFGGRVIWDEYMGSLSIIMLRDVMRDSANAVELPGDMGVVYKTEDDVRGFRLKYSASSEQSYNSITHVKNEIKGGDDTSYNYHGYKNVKFLEDGEEYSSYKDLVMGVSCYDANLYIDKITGNMFRVKVDGDAEQQGTWYPSVFETAGYRDVEVGDCSDDDFVKEVSIPFSPAISSMSNMHDMRVAMISGNSIPHPIYAQYVNGEIHNTGELITHKYVYANIPLETIIDSEGNSVHACHIDVEVTVDSLEEYNGNDSPVFDDECQNVIGVMRGSGSGSGIVFYDDNFDGEGTCKYMLTAGSDAEFFSDTVNHFGEMFDYNGGGETSIDRDTARVLLQSYFGGCGEDWTKFYNPVLTVGQVSGKWCILVGGDKVVGTYEDETSANAYLNLLNQLRAFFFTYTDNENHTVTIPENGLGYLPSDAVSLKLKAEKPKDGDETSGEYYPINPTFAKRGLFDKYYVDWAQFLLNHRIANIPYIMELAAFEKMARDTTKWYKFGDYVGLVKSATGKVRDDGKVEAVIRLAYL